MHERPMSSAFDPAAATLSFSGSIDELAAPAFTSTIAGALADARQTVVIDLSDVDYFPSVAVSALIEATRLHPDGYALLAGEGSIVQRVLHICGLPHRTE